MKPWLLMSVFVSVVLIFVSEPGPRRKASVSAEQSVTKVNRTWVEAFSHCDRSALNQIIADDCIITTEDGEALSKQQLIDLMQSQPPEVCKSEDLSITEVRVQSFGSISVITGLMSEKQEGKSVGLRYTNVFVRRNGRWMLVTSHVTHVNTVTLEIQPPKPPKLLSGIKAVL